MISHVQLNGTSLATRTMRRPISSFNIASRASLRNTLSLPPRGVGLDHNKYFVCIQTKETAQLVGWHFSRRAP